MYLFIRDELELRFYNGKCPLDTSLQKIFDTINGDGMRNVVVDIFEAITERDHDKGKGESFALRDQYEFF